MEEETLPLKLEDLKEIKEFYLMVVGHEGKERIKKRIGDTLVLDKVDGSLMEVIKRTPHSLDGFLIADVGHIIFPNGEKVGKDIKEVFKNFIFYPEHVELVGERSVVMIGNAIEYRLHDNYIKGKLNDKVFLYFDAFELKTKGSIGCF